MADLPSLIPPYRVPIVDVNGNCSRAWYIFFQAIASDGVCLEGGRISPDVLPESVGLIDENTGEFPIEIIPDIPAAKII